MMWYERRDPEARTYHIVRDNALGDWLAPPRVEVFTLRSVAAAT
jgi:hypothetical protein